MAGTSFLNFSSPEKTWKGGKEVLSQVSIPKPVRDFILTPISLQPFERVRVALDSILTMVNTDRFKD